MACQGIPITLTVCINTPRKLRFIFRILSWWFNIHSRDRRDWWSTILIIIGVLKNLRALQLIELQVFISQRSEPWALKRWSLLIGHLVFKDNMLLTWKITNLLVDVNVPVPECWCHEPPCFKQFVELPLEPVLLESLEHFHLDEVVKGVLKPTCVHFLKQHSFAIVFLHVFGVCDGFCFGVHVCSSLSKSLLSEVICDPFENFVLLGAQKFNLENFENLFVCVMNSELIDCIWYNLLLLTGEYIFK